MRTNFSNSASLRRASANCWRGGGAFAPLLQIVDRPQRGLNLVRHIVRNQHDFLGNLGLVVKLGEIGLERLVQTLEFLHRLGRRRLAVDGQDLVEGLVQLQIQHRARLTRRRNTDRWVARLSTFLSTITRSNRSRGGSDNSFSASATCSLPVKPNPNRMRRAAVSPSSIRLQISTSCSRVSSGTLPICRRYICTGSSNISSRLSSSSSTGSTGFGPLQIRRLHDLHLEAPQLGINRVQHFRRHHLVGQRVVDVVVSQIALVLRNPQQVLDFLDNDGRINRRRSRRETGQGRGGYCRAGGRVMGVAGLAVAALALPLVCASKLKRAFFATVPFLLEVVKVFPMFGPLTRLFLLLDIIL